eukprot:SAG31_NODE_662_length_13028_cov_3.364529_7_plen_75_part_00
MVTRWVTNIKYSGTCTDASHSTCHGRHASGMRISVTRGGAAGGSRDMDTERDPQKLDTPLVARLPVYNAHFGVM